MLAAVLAGIGVLSLQRSSVILHVTQHYETLAINLADRAMSFGNATMSLIDPSRNIQGDELKLEELAGSLVIGATTYALSNVCEAKEGSRSDLGEIVGGFEDELHSTHSSACVDRESFANQNADTSDDRDRCNNSYERIKHGDET